MFHSEFVPFERTMVCVEAAEEMFGPNVIVYMPHMYDLLSRMPEHTTHTLEEFCRYLGIDPESEQVPGLYHVIPGGRAPEALRNCYTPYPVSYYRSQNCRSELLSTSHFHIDHHGNLFTGLCAGIVAGTTDNLHPQTSEEDFPVFTTLCGHGPCGLVELAKERHGFIERPDGYVSKCDLCFQVRRRLHATGQFPELRPGPFYTVD
jgi:hypothetical protein